ncbi:outer dense fiber protein 2 isoform X1 [Callorhinchus milii]|uniref:outer dense fiber protein 2 isoform X1 n=1 Tax=Callorhinchus milii TaxID=7868 RepID=UPI001C3FC54F|nr:outer dense fiber protein 2 isoform X1 [Callorhinchus milii]
MAELRVTLRGSDRPEPREPTQETAVTPQEAETIYLVLHSSEASVDHKVNIRERMDQYEKQIDSLMEDLESLKSELPGHKKIKQSEEHDNKDTFNLSNKALKDYGEELSDLSQELARTTSENRNLRESFEKLQKELDQRRLQKEERDEDNLLLQALAEAEVASMSAAIQVATFENAIADLMHENRVSASGLRTITGGKDLLEKLESFKTTNRTLQHLLRDLWSPELNLDYTNRQIDMLIHKLTRSEIENNLLKRKFLETERSVKELSELYQMEKDNSDCAKQMSKSVEATRAHLQGQLRNKEAENNRLSVQIVGLERTVIDQNLQIENLKSQLSTVKEKAEEDKEGLKKATRAQKRRAERFEATIANLTSQLNDKDVKLSEARLALDSWKKQHETAVEDKTLLETEIVSLQDKVAGLEEQLQGTTVSAVVPNSELVEKLQTSNFENYNLNLKNAQLKASIAALEEKTALTETELEKMKDEAKQQEEAVAQYEMQVQLLQTTTEDLEAKLGKTTKENHQLKDVRLMETKRVKDEMEPRLKELKPFPELLKAAEHRLYECEKNLLCLKRRFSDQSKSMIELQNKVDIQSLKSSLKTREPLSEEMHELQMKFEVLSRKLKEVDLQNQELADTVIKQEGALQLSTKQVEERTRESSALSRQLEAALHDVRKKVSEVKDQAVARERVLQNKILGLETEFSRKAKELKLLQHNNKYAEKGYDMNLQELKLCLEQSESRNQSIQSYVRLLKTTYSAMFGD